MDAASLPEPQAPAEPTYSEVRRFCIQHHNPLRPADLQREFRFNYYRAAALLEELEIDRVLWRQQDGSFTAYPERPRDANGRPLRNRAISKERNPDEERCEICDWCIARELRGRSSGCHDHHVIPVSCGGSDAPVNRLIVCPNHHQLAHVLFPVAGGVYRGPRTRDELAKALRLADADPDAYLLIRAKLAVSAMAGRLPPKPPPLVIAPASRFDLEIPTYDQEELIAVQSETWEPPPSKPRRARTITAVLIIRRHIREKHGCAIDGCVKCRERVLSSAAVGGVPDPATGQEENT